MTLNLSKYVFRPENPQKIVYFQLCMQVTQKPNTVWSHCIEINGQPYWTYWMRGLDQT